jgi:glycosidase
VNPERFVWPANPTVYEINTRVWLNELSRQLGREISLADVPQEEILRIASFGFDAVWLMGVWQHSPAARQVARSYPEWQPGFRQALPDLAVDDIVGSPYAIYDYKVDERLGGERSLAAIRDKFRELGMGLILDFVPNHMALDHPWLVMHPQRFVRGDAQKLRQQPANYFQAVTQPGEKVFAHGRDPYFDGWPDTLQLDYRSSGTRRAMSDLLLSIAEHCDGVRCDMAMLVSSEIFRRTWGGQFDPPAAEFWPAAFTDLKARFPGFLTMAEVYWDMEWQMQRQGFDFAYDKRLYDRLLHGSPSDVEEHLQADLDYQGRLVRFIENHDEPRAAAEFGLERSRAAAALALTLPGLRLVHEGQMEGWKVKLPVHLGRRKAEMPDENLQDFYQHLLDAVRQPVFHDGEWQLLQPGPDKQGDQSYRNIIAHQWLFGDHKRIVAANLSGHSASCLVKPGIPGLAGKQWILQDLLHGKSYRWNGSQMLQNGLYIELPKYGTHLFEIVLSP